MTTQRILTKPLSNPMPGRAPGATQLAGAEYWDEYRVKAVNLATLLTHTAKRFPSRLGVAVQGRRLTWAEMDSGASAVATELTARGLEPGDPVLVHSPNSPEMIMTMFGIWRAGGVLVPINFRSSKEEALGMAATARARIIVGHADFPGHIERVIEGLGLLAEPLVLGSDDPENGIDAIVRRTVDRVPDATVDQDAPAWYFFTSGTTGSPKAAILTHHTLGYIITNRLADILPDTTEDDVCLVIAPLSHGAGTHLLTQVARGAASVLVTSKPMSPEEIWRTIEEYRVTNFFSVPTILNSLAGAEATRTYDSSSLRYVIYGGAPMTTPSRDRANELLNGRMVQIYGMAEVTGGITVLRPEDHGREPTDADGVGPAGYPRIGVEISIQDDDGNRLPDGEKGLICVRGLAVFAGYLNNRDANSESFRDGWFRTGDIGYLSESGCLYVSGRASDMYISGGHNIYPWEIEGHLAHHPDLDESAIIGVPDDHWGEIGVAVCVPRNPHENLDVESLNTWLGERIARFKMPRRFIVRESLPKTAYGKIDKKALRSELAGIHKAT